MIAFPGPHRVLSPPPPNYPGLRRLRRRNSTLPDNPRFVARVMTLSRSTGCSASLPDRSRLTPMSRYSAHKPIDDETASSTVMQPESVAGFESHGEWMELNIPRLVPMLASQQILRSCSGRYRWAAIRESRLPGRRDLPLTVAFIWREREPAAANT